MNYQMESRRNRLLIKSLMILAMACDTFQEDAISPDKLVGFDQTDFYILPGTSAIIDVRSIVALTFTKGAVVLSKMPNRGTLLELNPLLLVYKPNSEFTGGIDVFEISIIENSKALATQTISIHMFPNGTGVNCPTFAVQDVSSISSDSPVSIDYLDNDRLCKLDIKSIQASIYLPPKHGEATLDGDVMIYSPHLGSDAFDTVVYKITVTDPSTGSSPNSFLGLITLARLSCLSYLPNDVHIDLTGSTDELNATGDCGEGVLIYQLMEDWRSCVEGKHFTVELMSQTGSSGLICYEPEAGFVFVSNAQGERENVNARFQICIEGQCTEISVYVHLLKTSWTSLGKVSDGQFTEDLANSLFFVNNQTGFVGGESIWKTVDGGLSWRQIFPWYTFGVLEINDIFFINENTGFAAYKNSFNGGLLKTVDGGENWTLVESPAENTVSVYFISPEVGFIGTIRENLPDSEMGRIYKTTDGGAHWDFSGSGWFRVQNIQFLNDGVGYAHAGGELLHTDDEGSTWKSISLSWMNPDPNESIAALANNGSQLFFKFAHTLWSSNGIDFLIKRRDDFDSYHNTISFSPSGKLGIAVGSSDWTHGGLRPEVLISSDHGETWLKSTFNWQSGGLELVDISIPADNMAFTLSRDGNILKFNQE